MRAALLASFISSLILLPISFGRCPYNCHGHGTCDIYSRCQCGNGYQGGDCSERICPSGVAWVDMATGTDIAHGKAECSNKGVCDHTVGECICQDGFVGTACERLACSNDCNGVGKCVSMNKRATYSRNVLSQQFNYASIWDANKIQGCVCDTGFSGYDCSERPCPSGDDPLTLNQVNEVQLIQCVSSTGSFLLYYGGLPTAWIPAASTAAALQQILSAHPLVTAVVVTLSPGYLAVCSSTPSVVSIEFTQDFGPLSPIVPLIDSAMLDVGGSVTVSADGYSPLTDSAGSVYVSVKGTKEDSVCSGRGLCDRTAAVCSCFRSFGDIYDSSDGMGGSGLRGDCGWVRSSTQETVSSCPGEIQCSGHGTCNGTALIQGGDGSYTCTCDADWTAGDCSERQCPLGLSWFDYPSANDVAHTAYSECSDMGLCDRDAGKCACRDLFFGKACEYLNCPGDIGNTCSGHGKCLSMAQLAQVATVNGVIGGFSYGSDPNSAATWDADRVLGCSCDAGYGGYDCSLRLCPVGDDPGTYNDHPEVQLLQCIATSGTFSLTFRESTTGPLLANATSVDELVSALEALPSLAEGNIFVYKSSDGSPINSTFFIFPPPIDHIDAHNNYPTSIPTVGPTIHTQTNNTLCNATGSQILIIEFNGISGALPPLLVDTSQLQDNINANGADGTGSMSVFTSGMGVGGYVSVTGTTESDVCNGRGICDETSGWCRCFQDWGSSDGNGGLGGRGDCGYRRDDMNPAGHIS